MIRTRFSPSPTGMIHLGNARAALFSALFAAKSQGAFLLRIEDTDATRSEQKYSDQLQEDLHWLGINWQEGPGIEGPHAPYFQSQRKAIYDRYYQQLEKENLAYPCFCSDAQLAINRKLQLAKGKPPRYLGTCRKLSSDEIANRIAQGEKPTLRFRVPENTKIEFTDLVKGHQQFNSEDIGDFIIRRANGSASFLFCNAIDDALMKISHVIRGEDHLANTPRQLMILKSLTMHTPQYGHLSMITGDDGSPLSKRHGSFGLHDVRQQGFLSKALLNYLARLSHTYEQLQLLSFSELADHFHFEKLSRAPARFDKNQLQHWQKEAVMQLDNAEVWHWLGDKIKEKVPEKSRDLFSQVMRENILFPEEAVLWAEIFFGNDLQFSAEKMQVLQQAGETFFSEAKKISESNGHDLKIILQTLKDNLNVSGKNLFMPIRIALTGEMHGPELAQIGNLLGAAKIQQRFLQVIALIKSGEFSC